MYHSFRKHRFGLEARAKRDVLGFTLHEMEIITEIDDSTLSRIERGAVPPTLPQFMMLCNALDLKPSRYFAVLKDK